MKNFLFLFTAVILTVTSVNAQSKNESAPARKEQKSGTIEQKSEKFAGRLYKELGLTEDQRKQVYQAKFDALTKMKKLDDAYGKDNRSAHKEEYEAVRADFRTRMRGILTPEQFAKWEKMKEEKKEKK